MNNLNKNPLILAYLGDAIYEILVRNYLVNKNINDINILNNMKINLVSASSQAKILDNLLDNNYLTDEEIFLIRRTRNHKVKSKPKNVCIKIYKKATAFEALFGLLYLNNDINRINEIFKIIIGD